MARRGHSRAPRLLRLIWLATAVWLTGCSAEHFDRPGAGGDEALYTAVYPYYVEFCALSQIMKKPGFGADIRGQMGGHAVFYLNGACRDPDTDYPTLRLCDQQAGSPVDGVGLSMNEHFSNAKWVAVPGRAFFFDGGLPPHHGLTRADYVHAKEQAKQLRIYSGVTFHPEFFDDKPADVSQEDWKYEISIATDYATSFGRGRFCARVPVTRAQMARMVTFLNAQNAPYRDGRKEFHWSVFRDNCIHLAHNALAAAGLWQEWPINRSLLIAVFDFPVPKNEFVNLMRRTNDPANVDLAALYHDEATRRSLAEFDRLPWEPGALAEARPPQRPNDVYDTTLKLVFYDEPTFGHYQGWFDQIFGQPRYFDLEQNLDYFAGLFRRISADRKPIDTWLAEDEFRSPAAQQRFADFYARFYSYIKRERNNIDRDLAMLRGTPRLASHPLPTVPPT
jgi:hypothetical protein